MDVVRVLTEGGPQRGSTTASQTSIGAASALVLSSNAKRKGLIIQNTGTTIIKLNLSTVAVTQNVYHVALKACTAADDGTGGAYFDDSWVGPVTAISSGAGGTMVITEITGNSPDWDQAADWGLQGRLSGSAL